MKIFTLCLILIFAFDTAFACTCSNTNEAESIKILKKQAVVFQGEVIEISEPKTRKLFNREGIYYDEQEYLEVKFSIHKLWKGINSDAAIVEVEPDNSSCSLRYEVGQTSIVVADGSPLKTGLCYRGKIDSSKFSEILGTPKVFEKIPKHFEISESFWSKIWNKIFSFFS